MTTTELPPNAEMSQDLPSDFDATPFHGNGNSGENGVERPTINAIVHRFASLDMNPTADDAYEQAVLAQAHTIPDSVMPWPTQSNSQSLSVAPVYQTQPQGSSMVASEHDFLRLLSRFHQSVAPLPKSITTSFANSKDSDRAGSAAGKEASERRDATSSKDGSTSRLGYVPSRSYSRPNTVLARRRTSSAPSPAAAILRKAAIPPVFNDMESLLRKAGDLIDYMRRDVEDAMKRRRSKDREMRERSGGPRAFSPDGTDEDDDDDEPLVRKVPVSRNPWYTPPGIPLIHDSSVSPSLHTTSRPIITPRRLRSKLATIPEVTEPGEPLPPDAVDTCTSKLTSLNIVDSVPAIQLNPSSPPTSPTPPAFHNPIRLYVGYKPMTRPPFPWGSDQVSTTNQFEVAM